MSFSRTIYRRLYFLLFCFFFANIPAIQTKAHPYEHKIVHTSPIQQVEQQTIQKIKNKMMKINEKGPVTAYHNIDVREATTCLAQTSARIIH
jgi:hypothetical protein